MTEVAVVTACSMVGGLLPTYTEQLRHADIPLKVTVRPHPSGGTGNSGTLESKLDWLLSECRAHSKYRYLIFSDAWDVLYYGTRDRLLSKLHQTFATDQTPLLAAERVCYPDAYLLQHFKGTTPWRFVNGGLLAGTPLGIQKWALQIKQHTAYVPHMIDQQFFNQRLLVADPLIRIDNKTELFYCVLEDQGELLFTNGQPLNSATMTKPHFLHFNGKCDHTKHLLMCEISKLQAKEATAR